MDRTDNEHEQDAPSRTRSQRALGQEGVAYLVKAVALVVVLFVLARVAPALPAPAVALAIAVLSAASALGIAYYVVIRKTHKQLTLKEGGWLSRFNNGRAITLVASFVLAAIMITGLMLEMPKWGVPEWCLVVLAVPVYLAVLVIVKRKVGSEYEPPFRLAKEVAWSTAITGVLLCAAAAVVYALQPAPAFSSMSDAYLSTTQAFAESPSALMSEAGKLQAFLDGATAYGVSRASEVSFAGYLAWRIVLIASALFGVATLLGTCALPLDELKKVFLPLASGVKQAGGSAPMMRHVALAAALPVCLLVAFLAVDGKVAQAVATDEHAAAESFIRDQMDVVAYVIDGTYYKEKETRELVEQTKRKAQDLSDAAADELVPLINASYDARLANVDAYLDWYYSLPADYGRLLEFVKGSVSGVLEGNIEEKINESVGAFMQDELVATLEKGVDDTQLATLMQDYAARTDELKSEFQSALDKLEITDTPAWLIKVEEAPDIDISFEAFEPADKLLEAPARWGVSMAAGVGAGVLTKKLVSKIAQRQFFKTIVSKVGSTVVKSAAGAAIGGAIGTAAGPAGTAAGIAAGLAVTVALDFGWLKADEALNRESYKAEIIQAIEEERADVLSAL